jgi:protein-S-isoprenylcysteine O-methyltransferase Ste14
MSFAYGIDRVFCRESYSCGMIAITAIGTSGFALDVFCIICYTANNDRLICAAVINSSAMALFWWAASTIRRRPLSLAFSDDAPSFLFRNGPFRFVRHPFYTSYIMFWASNAVASRSGWLLMPFVTMTAIYVVALRGEERKFASSPLASDYRDYRATTGAVFPRIWGR